MVQYLNILLALYHPSQWMLNLQISRLIRISCCVDITNDTNGTAEGVEEPQRPLDNVLLLLLQNSETKIWEFVSASYSRGGGTKMRDIEKK